MKSLQDLLKAYSAGPDPKPVVASSSGYAKPLSTSLTQFWSRVEQFREK